MGRIAPLAAELGVAGLHLFPFGGFAQSTRWMDNAAAGKIPFREPGGSVNIEPRHHAN